MSGRESAAETRRKLLEEMARADQETAQRRVDAAREAGVEPDPEDVATAEDSGPAFMAVEVHRSKDVHLAKNWGTETLCGKRVDFPVGKREATCGPCREAAGMEEGAADITEAERTDLRSRCLGASISPCDGGLRYEVRAPKLDQRAGEAVVVLTCASAEHLGLAVDGLARHEDAPDVHVTRWDKERSVLPDPPKTGGDTGPFPGL